MEPLELERWGLTLVEHAAELILAQIPNRQQPKITAGARARSAGAGYVARYVHFEHPDWPEPRAVWLYVVPAGHEYNFDKRRDRAIAGLKRDSSAELDEARAAAGLMGVTAFQWKTPIKREYAGYRLSVDIEPKLDEPGIVGKEPASRVEAALRRARLIPDAKAVR